MFDDLLDKLIVDLRQSSEWPSIEAHYRERLKKGDKIRDIELLEDLSVYKAILFPETKT